MEIQSIIKQRYMDPNRKYGFSLFECLSGEGGISRGYIDEPWRWIHEFIKDKNIIVFFEYERADYFELPNGNAFVDFYEDKSWQDEFYITDKHGTFLLGINHSHALFTLGTAVEWLRHSEPYLEYFKDQALIDYCVKNGLEYHLQNVEHIRALIREKYMDLRNKYSSWGYIFSIYDALKRKCLLNIDDTETSWQWIQEFIKDKSIIVIFNCREIYYIELPKGNTFFDFYNNSSSHEFYITDKKGTFLLGLNNEGCLFAMGTAMDEFKKNEQ